MIKLYPDGHFSGLLADGSIAAGDELEIKGPYGVFTLRENERRLLFIGGGAGMAPILSHAARARRAGLGARRRLLLRRPHARGTCSTCEELEQLGESLPAFRFVPALSEKEDWGEAARRAHHRRRRALRGRPL